MHDDHPARIAGIYTQPYNEIVRPERVWKISKYFLRRWTPYLSANEVWLVIGARQLSYFNERRPWFRAYDSTLAEAAGLHVKVFRRTIKKAICGGEGFISSFLRKTADPHYQRRDGVTRQTQTRYSIRLDDPLTPGDAAALAYWLRRHSPSQVTPHSVSALLEEALAQRLHAIRADDLAPVPSEARDLLSVADVVSHVFANVANVDDAGEASPWRETADKLHTHIVCPELAHFETQYFRLNWMPQLGAGPALLLSYLRSLCYHNEDSGEIRDQIALESGHLEEVFQVSSRTLRRWFARLDDAAGDDPAQGAFLETVDAVKQPTQKVLTSYWINLRTPLTTEDLPVYRQALRNRESTTERVTDEKFPTPTGVTTEGTGQKVPHTSKGNGQKVPHTQDPDGQKDPHRNGGGGQKGVHDPAGTGQIVAHTLQGSGQPVPHEKGGEGQKVPGWVTNEGSYKYYKILSELAGHSSLKDLWAQIPEQQQHCWRLADETAHLAFAAAVCDQSVSFLLEQLGVQDPARSEILARHASAEEIVAWLLYALQQDGLERPLSYVIRRLCRDDPPPLDTLQLANLSWEQWRTYAWAWHARTFLGQQFNHFRQMPLFGLWGEMYAGVPLSDLPFDVGAGLDHLFAGQFANTADRGSGAVQDSRDPPQAPVWRDVLDELALQMTRATFDAWLRDTHLVEVDGDSYVVAVARPEAREWLESRLRATVDRTVQTVTEGRVQHVAFVIQDPRAGNFQDFS